EACLRGRMGSPVDLGPLSGATAARGAEAGQDGRGGAVGRRRVAAAGRQPVAIAAAGARSVRPGRRGALEVAARPTSPAERRDVREELPDVPLWPQDGTGVVEARAVSAIVGDGLRIWSLYVPNGREIDHPHMAYKLRWLDALRAEGARTLAEEPDTRTVLVGD